MAPSTCKKTLPQARCVGRPCGKPSANEAHGSAGSKRCGHGRLVLFPGLQALATLQPRSIWRARCFEYLRSWLRTCGLPTTKNVVARVPIPEMLNPAKCQFRKILRQHLQPQTAQWCFSRIRFCHGKPRCHQDAWTHVRHAKDMNWDMFDNIPSSVMQDTLSGPGLRRVDKAWDVPCFLNNEDLRKTFQHCVRTALARVKACKYNCWPCLPDKPLKAYCARRDACRPAYMEHTKDMKQVPGSSIVPDDKNKKHAWRMSQDAYRFLLAYFVLLAANWRVTSLDALDANKLCREHVASLLPRHLLTFLGMRRKAWLLPYAYAMIKAKCFTPQGRTCLSPGHSCIRKVISFATWPKKSRWRMISRGLQIALQRGLTCWQVWTMRDAPATLRKRMSMLTRPEDAFVCCRCGCKKAAVEATAHDAGQFFECVSVMDALRAAKEVLDMTVARTGCFYVCVFRRKKKAGFLSTHNFPFLARKMRCFNFQGIFLVFAAAISVTFVSVGSRVIQLSTLSIGGIMSMIASAVALCLNEHKWLQDSSVQSTHNFEGSIPWEQQVAALRYVDDLLQISAMYCASCLAIVPSLVYDVPFKLASRGTTVTWIDLQIDVEHEIIGMVQKHANIKPPWAAPRGYARSWLCGRFARWQQVGLSHAQTVAEVTHAFWELLEHGYSPKALRAIVYSFKHERWAAEYRVLQACYSVAKARQL